MPIELRSDTFSQPTPAMREAIASAVCGDDMVGEDPTVNRLEAMVAEMLGKEAAVFACSGTQSNQMGVWVNCQRGDELLIESTGHIANYESGGPAILSGVSVRRISGDFGRLDVEQLEGQIRGGNQHFAPTTLLCLENSTNLGGGRTYPLDQLQRVCDWAHERGLKTHLDGARIFNACVARSIAPRDVANCFDTVSICFSKGLGCPMGSILVGSANDMARARRARKVFGGALRQTGIVAAAAIHALEQHIDRLADDHANARRFAEAISQLPHIHVDVAGVETNLAFFEIDPVWGTAAQLSQQLKERGVHINPAGGEQRLRACTHLDVTRDQIDQAVAVLREIVTQGAAAHQTSSAGTYG
ncbi:MAG: aminotransferase class I/II-fold pyridoxal phosphate-dependent enzyme [Planctomycetaceae bacterium]|nr:aminotransferase class I/II-fold pyridoxal phosphate-dependent enzyme [Planctomycetaceae bacterium]